MEPWYKIGDIEYSLVNAGYFWSDGGAAMGILPKAIWQQTCKTDEKGRIKFSLDTLLIKYKGKTALVDTGMGERIDDKTKKINSPSNFELVNNLERIGITPEKIDFVILTHLHNDHCGGVISGKSKPYLTFPEALHIIQKKEWEKAKYPDALNRAAYNFNHNLSLLEERNNSLLIDGDYQLFPDVKIKRLGGHTEGMQGVRIAGDDEIVYYPGDLFPMIQLLSSTLVSAYDVCRKESFKIKTEIIDDVKKHKGKIVLNHDPEVKFVDYLHLK